MWENTLRALQSRTKGQNAALNPWFWFFFTSSSFSSNNAQSQRIWLVAINFYFPLSLTGIVKTEPLLSNTVIIISTCNGEKQTLRNVQPMYYQMGRPFGTTSSLAELTLLLSLGIPFRLHYPHSHKTLISVLFPPRSRATGQTWLSFPYLQSALNFYKNCSSAAG